MIVKRTGFDICVDPYTCQQQEQESIPPAEVHAPGDSGLSDFRELVELI